MAPDHPQNLAGRAAPRMPLTRRSVSLKLYVRTYEETAPGPTLRCRSVHCHTMNHEELGMMQTVGVA